MEDAVLEAMEEYRKNTPPNKKKEDLERLENECFTEMTFEEYLNDNNN